MALDGAQMSNEIALSIQNLISALVGLPIATIPNKTFVSPLLYSPVSTFSPTLVKAQLLSGVLLLMIIAKLRLF